MCFNLKKKETKSKKKTSKITSITQVFCQIYANIWSLHICVTSLIPPNFDILSRNVFWTLDMFSIVWIFKVCSFNSPILDSVNLILCSQTAFISVSFSTFLFLFQYLCHFFVAVAGIQKDAGITYLRATNAITLRTQGLDS